MKLDHELTKVREYAPPVDAASLHSVEQPAIFLAGPIQGAPDWQQEATLTIGYIAQTDSLSVYNPRAEKMDHGKKRQIQWEKDHLARARNHGAVLFWFAAQDLSLDYPKGRAYAQTTRVEFGRAMGWLDYARDDVNIALGIQSGYAGGNEEYIRDCAQEFDLQVHSELELLCRQAVRLATKDRPSS